MIYSSLGYLPVILQDTTPIPPPLCSIPWLLHGLRGKATLKLHASLKDLQVLEKTVILMVIIYSSERMQIKISKGKCTQGKV